MKKIFYYVIAVFLRMTKLDGTKLKIATANFTCYSSQRRICCFWSHLRESSVF